MSNKPKINPNRIAERIKQENGIMFLGNRFYLYKGGVYKESDGEIPVLVKNELGNYYSTHLLKEIKASLQATTMHDVNHVNLASDYLNVKNGLLDLKSLQLLDHFKEYHSTMQIVCDYHPESKCEKWLDFLLDVLGDDPEKIDILQEFLGYCLTPSAKHEKALMLIGDGANGKSVILKVWQAIIGFENTAAIPLEQFKNAHYLYELFGRMVNISTETNTKTQVYESTFKQLVSGETVTADQKYGHPFKFKNACKLIFAFNEFPRVDDKTDAYYRRIIPIPFHKQIPEKEQNKCLVDELLLEKSGILNWAILGLKRLEAQGRFSTCGSVQELIDEYRKDNNNVIGFVEERCQLEPDAKITKRELHQAYQYYCKENGFQSLSDKRFGKQLRKHRHSITDDFGTNNVKLWAGVSLK